MQKLFLVLALLFAMPTFAVDTRTELSATIFDQLDANVLDTSSTNINGSAGALVTVVASLANSASFCRVVDQTGKFIGVYEGSTFKFMITPGMDDTIRCPFANAALVRLRSMETAAITSGKLVIQFLR